MILVDVHEPQEIIAALQKSTEVTVQVLSHGDYLIKNIAIERKTASDFLSSLTTHRLFPQLTKMKSCYPASFLIVEIYDLNYFSNTSIIYGTLLYILLDLNIKILFTSTPLQTAHVILLIAGKKLSSSSVLAPPSISGCPHIHLQPTIEYSQHQLLAKIPTIGKKRARILLNHFHSPKNIFNASPQELQRIPNIGKKSAQNIKKVWEKEHREQHNDPSTENTRTP